MESVMELAVISRRGSIHQAGKASCLQECPYILMSEMFMEQRALICSMTFLNKHDGFV